MVHMCADYADFKAKTATATTIVDFTASWCGPCKAISPFYNELATKYPSVQFIKVDVDEVDQAAAEAGVTAMPSFFVYKEGKVVDQMVGASKEKLEELVKKYA